MNGTVIGAADVLVIVTTPLVSVAVTDFALCALAHAACSPSTVASVASFIGVSGVVVQALYCESMELMRLRIVYPVAAGPMRSVWWA